jgi:hypothetical protein
MSLERQVVHYKHVKNNANNATYAVIVDPGNGKVLYKQPLLSLLGGGIGHFGMFGQGKMGPFSGAAGGHNRGGFGETIGPSHMGPTGSIPPRSW